MNSNTVISAPRFFAAANSKDGFVSYFDDIFLSEECERLYILKGGPGVGKSTFMKKTALEAEKMGCTVSRFFCSSDTHSLDGIIIHEKGISVIDGTRPHTREPVMAGVQEIIINLGVCWDTQKLYGYSSPVKALNELKNQYYDRAYSMLNSKNNMCRCVDSVFSKHILVEKLDKCSSQLCSAIQKSSRASGQGRAFYRLTDAVSCTGKVHLSSFEDSAEYCIFLKEPLDCLDVSSLLLQRLSQKLSEKGTDMLVSKNPLDTSKINGLFVCGTNTAIVPYNKQEVEKCDRASKPCKIINTQRFIEKPLLTTLKKEARFYSKNSILHEKQALFCLERCGSIHQSLEEIYGKCTNYDMVEELTDYWIEKILKD